MAEMTRWVHQYTLRELIDDTFDLFRERASTLLLAGVLPFLLLVVYVVLMRIFVIPGNLLEELLSKTAWENLLFSPQFLLFLCGFLLLGGVTGACGYIAQCRIAAWHALGMPVSLPRAFRLLAKPLLGLVVVSLLLSLFSSVCVSVAMGVGSVLSMMLALLVAAIGGPPAGAVVGVLIILVLTVLAVDSFVFTGVFFLGAPVVLAVEHAWPGVAIGKSFQAGQGHFKANFWALYTISRLPAFLAVAGIVIAYLLQGPMAFVAPTHGVIISLLVSALSNIFFVALMACLQTLVYVDYRCRREALDLQLLAREIGLGEEFAEVQSAPPATAPTYPNYAAVPPVAATSAPLPTAPGLTPPPAHAAYPDYSKPPEAVPVTAPADAADPPLTPATEVGDAT